MHIAFFGVGFMGYGIAHNLLKAGHTVRVIAHHNRDRIDKLVQTGAVEYREYHDLLHGAEVVFSCVGTAEQLEIIVDRADSFLDSTNLWVDCTTSLPTVAKKISRHLKTKGVDFVDAPVTRSPQDAAAGKLVSLVGAEPEVFQRVQPLISCYSESIIHWGPVGSGLQAKLINNFITMGQVALVVEAMRAADRAGIDRQKLYTVLTQSAANSGTLNKMVGPSLKGDFSGHAFSLGNGAKDVRYGSEMLAESDTGRILSDALTAYYKHQLNDHPDTLLLSELLKD